MNFCPSIYEITSGEVLPPHLAAHISNCPRCQAIRAAWEADTGRDDQVALEDVPEVHWPHPVYADVDAKPVPGAVHSVWGAEDGQLLVALVLDVNAREALVVPVSDQVGLAGDWDVLLDESVLPYRAMLEVWNHVRVLREQLMEQVARVNENWAGALADAFTSFMTGERLPDGLRQGPALGGERDPRDRFRDAESERVRWFTEPWRILYAAETFGGVLQGRRDECELDLAELEEDLDFPSGSLARLEGDTEDLNAQVPKAKLVRLIDQLRLPASSRLVDLVEQAAFANARQAPPETQMVRARRRQGVRSATPQLPEEVRRQIAASYVDGLLDSLKDRG